MSAFMIRVAGLNINVDAKYSYLPSLCKDYIVDDSETADIDAVATDEKIVLERTRSDELVEPHLAESLCVYRDIAEQLPKFDRIVFHGAAISYKGKAYLFTAPSGTGKTTHINLWRKYIGDDVGVVNGDKPILWVHDSAVKVCGTPWAGKEGWQSNCCMELAAVCFIGRGTDNSCISVPSSDCLVDLLKQTYMPADPEQAVNTLDIIDKIVKTVPFYKLSCDISEDAVRSSFEKLTGETYQN